MDVKITSKSLEIRVGGLPNMNFKVCLKMDTTYFNPNAILELNLYKMTSQNGLIILTVEVLFEYFFPSWLHDASEGAPTPKITSLYWLSDCFLVVVSAIHPAVGEVISYVKSTCSA